MKLAIIAAVCLIVGTAFGFGFMFWVATAMVEKVQAREDAKHAALLNEIGDQAGEWMDVVNDILDAVQHGRLSNRSVPDQVSIIRTVINDARQHKTTPVEHLE